MAALVCDICGGKLISKAGGIFECEYCGMQYDKTRIQEMVQEIKGTVKVEGTVEVTGTVKLDGPVKVESSISIDNLLKRGFMQLEDGRWDTATETFNQILAMDPENGRAYLGLAMATQHVYSIYEIEKIVSGHGSGRNILIKHDKNFKRAEKYADGELKARFAHWNELREKYLATLEVERLARKKVDVKARAKLEPLRKKSATVAGLIAARINTVGLSSDGRVVATGYNEDGQCDVSDWMDIVAISVALRHTVGLRAVRRVVATGDNEDGQCDVSDWEDIVAISVGENHTAGLRSDGRVVATGLNNRGQCDVSDWEDIVAISADDNCTVGLRSDGRVVATGNTYVADWENIVAISAGLSHTVGLRSDGRVVATGLNNHGQCDVSEWEDIVAINVGRRCTVGLRSDGRVVATGDNEDGRCDVSDWEDIVAISTGYFHTVGLRSDGTTVATGNDEYCRCDVSNWTDIVAISAGYYHTVGLRSDGTVVAVGWNRDGECLVSDWKLFDNYENLDQEREVERIVWEKRFEEERRRNTGLCQHCGGELKGFFTKKCVACGKPKDY